MRSGDLMKKNPLAILIKTDSTVGRVELDLRFVSMAD